MIFLDFEDVPLKLSILNDADLLWYNKENGVVASLKMDFEDKILSSKDKAKFTSFYKKAYYYLTQLACVECREFEMIRLDNEMGVFMEYLKKEYGGK